MKQLFYFFGLLISIMLLVTGCPDKEETVNCDWEGLTVFTKTYATDSSITIYPVVTPNQKKEYCDYLVYSSEYNTWLEPSSINPELSCTKEVATAKINDSDTTNDHDCPCRKVDDYYEDNINSALYIDGIEKYPFNILKIFTLDDTTHLRAYGEPDDSTGIYPEKGYTNVTNVFNGYYTTGIRGDLNYYEYAQDHKLESGIYRLELIIYKDIFRTKVLDTIRTNFAIINYEERAKNSNCKPVAKVKEDPLLMD